jgi:hypothetical protein
MKVSGLFLTTSLVVGFGFQTSAFISQQNQRLKKTERCTVSSRASSSTAASDGFLTDFSAWECDDSNMPPSLSIIMRSITNLQSGSDIRGTFVDHPRRGNMASVAAATGKSILPALTPFAAHCLGYAFATMLKESMGGEEVVVCIGRDPRGHGTVLADAFGRGAEGVNDVRVVYTGIATTPAMFEFCR